MAGGGPPIEPVSVCGRCGAPAVRAELAACPACLVEGTFGPSLLPEPASGAPQFPGFRVIERLGTGGMATVWLALQEDPPREVAIKVIRDDLDGAGVLERFTRELESLAAMEHPHIARIHAAFRLPDGRPYFVMEYVDGDTLDRYLSAHDAPLPTRLDLFEKICGAVAHAHQRGVIHRDLKPANILVTEVDGKPAPTLIDFGIARAITRAPGKHTIAGEILGTPASMSPEQTTPGQSTDTRTDVYGLGITLYVLLTGKEPFSESELTGKPLDEVLRSVRETAPLPPSRVAGKHSRAIRGDLDAITLKALAKKPSERYSSVEALAQDLFRHRHSMPVEARPAGVVYHATRFVRRHRWGVALGTTLAVALVGTTIGFAIQNERIRSARDLAEERRQDAVAVAAFMSNVVARGDPRLGAPGTMSVRQAVDHATEVALRDFGQRPAVRGMLASMLGATQIALGNYAKAEALLGESVASFRRAPPLGSDYATAVLQLANVENFRGAYPQARAHLEEALALRTELNGPRSLEVAEVLADLGDNAFFTGDPKRSLDFYQRSLAIERAVQPERNPRIDRRLKDLGDVAAALGDNDGAIRYYEQVRASLTARKKTRSLEFAVLQNSLGDLYITMGRWDDARPALEQALQLSEATQGADHPEIAHTLCLLGRLETHDGDLDRAEAYFRRALRITSDAEGQGARKIAEEGLAEIARLRAR